MRNAFVNTILDASVKRKDIFIVTEDAGLGVFDDFKDKYPGQYLNMGVAEQNATSFSAGMALAGYKVYIYNIIPFLLYRCYEQVRNDVCYQELPLVLVGIGSGITYAPQGMTHYSLEDLGIARTLPNLTVFSPMDPVEARAAARYSLTARGPVYVRLAKRGEPCIHEREDIDITLPQMIEDGEDVAILFHGSIGEEVVKARNILKKSSISPRLISVPMVQPFQPERLFSMLNGMRYVLSVEEHFVGIGLGSILARECLKSRPQWELFQLGIPDMFVHEIKKTDGMREHFGISAAKIAGFVVNTLKRGR